MYGRFVRSWGANEWKKKLSKQDAEQVRTIAERLNDPGLRYFYLMLGTAIADFVTPEKTRRTAIKSRPPNRAWLARLEQ